MASLHFDDDGIQRLEGSSGQETGGLIIMKKKPSGESHTFKKPEMPKVSLLGLDKLAAVKRQTDNSDGSATPKRSKVSSYKDDDDDDDADVEEEKSSDKSKGSHERYLIWVCTVRIFLWHLSSSHSTFTGYGVADLFAFVVDLLLLFCNVWKMYKSSLRWNISVKIKWMLCHYISWFIMLCTFLCLFKFNHWYHVTDKYNT